MVVLILMIFKGGGEFTPDSLRNSEFTFKTAWIDAENSLSPPESRAGLTMHISKFQSCRVAKVQKCIGAKLQRCQAQSCC